MNRKAPVKKWLPKVAGFGVILVMYGLVRWLLQIPSRSEYLGGSMVPALLGSIKGILVYIGVTLLPLRLTLDHTVPTNLPSFTNVHIIDPMLAAQKITDWPVLLALGVIAALVGLAVWWSKRQPLFAFGTGWFLVALMPVVNILPIYTLCREMYLYIASFGFCLIAGVGLERWLKTSGKTWFKPVAIAGIAGLLVFYGVRTWVRNYDWRDEITLWQATLKYSPQNPMVWYKLGSAYQQAGKEDEAESVYSQALQIKDDLAFVHYNLGILYEQRGETQRALNSYQAAVVADGALPQYNLTLAKYLYYHNQPELALPVLETYVQAVPGNEEAVGLLVTWYNQAGIDKAQAGEIKAAENLFKQTLLIHDCPADTWNNLGTLAVINGDKKRAKNHFEQALTCNPNFNAARENLSRL